MINFTTAMANAVQGKKELIHYSDVGNILVNLQSEQGVTVTRKGSGYSIIKANESFHISMTEAGRFVSVKLTVEGIQK